MTSENRCYEICSDLFYEDDITMECLPCHATCKKCFGPLSNECSRCDED